MCFDSYRVAVSSKATVVSSKFVAEAVEKLNLEEAVGKAVAMVLVVGLVLDMEKDLSMMEEENGRPYLQSKC